MIVICDEFCMLEFLLEICYLEDCISCNLVLPFICPLVVYGIVFWSHVSAFITCPYALLEEWTHVDSNADWSHLMEQSALQRSFRSTSSVWHMCSIAAVNETIAYLGSNSINSCKHEYIALFYIKSSKLFLDFLHIILKHVIVLTFCPCIFGNTGKYLQVPITYTHSIHSVVFFAINYSHYVSVYGPVLWHTWNR